MCEGHCIIEQYVIMFLKTLIKGISNLFFNVILKLLLSIVLKRQEIKW